MNDKKVFKEKRCSNCDYYSVNYPYCAKILGCVGYSKFTQLEVDDVDISV